MLTTINLSRMHLGTISMLEQTFQQHIKHFCWALIFSSMVLMGQANAALRSPPFMSMLEQNVTVTHRSGEDVIVLIDHEDKAEQFVLSLEEISDHSLVRQRLITLDAGVFEAVLSAIIRIQRSEVLASSQETLYTEVEWVTDACNDTDARCPQSLNPND